MIRRGRYEQVHQSTYRPVDVFAMLADLRLAPGEGIEDVRARMDPERVADVLGVRKDGRLDAPDVHAFGEKLLTNGTLGVDLLVVPPGAGFPPHIHPGHHLLLCLTGRGTFTLDRVVYDVQPGYLAMIEGAVPHAVGNPYDQPHVLLAIGSPHRELDSPDRMRVVDWDGTPLLVEGHPHDSSHGHGHDHGHAPHHYHPEGPR